MNLLFITEFFPDSQQVFTGGVEARTWFTVKLLRRHHSVKVISRRSSQVAATPFSVLSRLLFMFLAITKSAHYHADMVEGSNVICYLPAWIIARLKRARTVAWVPDVLGADWHHFGIIGTWGRLWEWFSLKLPWDHYLALSRETQTKLLALGIQPHKITVVYPGVSRHEWAVPVLKRHLPSLCVIARLVKYKHVDQTIALTQRLKSAIPNIRLVIIGQGPEKKHLLHQVKQLNLDANVYFKSNLPRQDLIKELKSCHVFIHLSLVEGFGLSLLEALAAGIPYVAYDTSINREVTHSGQGGFLIPVDHLDQAAIQVQNLLADMTLYHQKIAEGKSLVKNYSWRQSVAATETIYQSLLKK